MAKSKEISLPLFCILLGISFMGISFSGCAAPAKIVPKPVVVTPPPAPEKLEELVVSQIEEKKEPERLLSFSMREADVREVLLSMSKTLGYSMVLEPDVSGKVTVEAKRVTFEEAMDAMLTPLGLQHKKGNNIIKVSKMKRETRFFFLNYITSKRSGSSSITSSIAIGGGGGGGGISTTDSADLWTDIENGLKGFLSEGARVAINKMAGVIVVTDYPPNLKNIGNFLEKVEGSVQRQVMIQAKVVDVTLFDDFKLGLNWSAITKFSALKIKGTLSGGMMIAQNLSPATGVFQIGLSDTDFSALLDAMATQGTLNILSSPKISVLNNQKAVIKASRSEVFYEIRSEIDPITKVERITPSPKTVDIGVVLEVIPQISADGNIVMDIHPIITEKVGESTFEHLTTKISTPILTIRETNSVVKIRDGQTMVLAGLIQERTEDKKTEVPILRSLPLVGSLFKQTMKSGRKSELVIFITPTILAGKKIEELSREEKVKFEKELK
ncbi:MAG: hypothetical protein KKH04_18445 [Proteobacteria bacterium]|nr:hypothetical protein [Pseudomonadota bacterium]